MSHHISICSKRLFDQPPMTADDPHEQAGLSVVLSALIAAGCLRFRTGGSTRLQSTAQELELNQPRHRSASHLHRNPRNHHSAAANRILQSPPAGRRCAPRLEAGRHNRPPGDQSQASTLSVRLSRSQHRPHCRRLPMLAERSPGRRPAGRAPGMLVARPNRRSGFA